MMRTPTSRRSAASGDGFRSGDGARELSSGSKMHRLSARSKSTTGRGMDHSIGSLTRSMRGANLGDEDELQPCEEAIVRNNLEAILDLHCSAANKRERSELSMSKIKENKQAATHLKNTYANQTVELYDHYKSVAEGGLMKFTEGIQGNSFLRQTKALSDNLNDTLLAIEDKEQDIAEYEVRYDEFADLIGETAKKMKTHKSTIEALQTKHYKGKGNDPVVDEALIWHSNSEEDEADNVILYCFGRKVDDLRAESSKAANGDEEDAQLIAMAIRGFALCTGPFPEKAQKEVTQHLLETFNETKLGHIRPELRYKSQAKGLKGIHLQEIIRYCAERGLDSNKQYLAVANKPKEELRLLYAEYVVDALPSIHTMKASNDFYFEWVCFLLQLEA